MDHDTMKSTIMVSLVRCLAASGLRPASRHFYVVESQDLVDSISSSSSSSGSSDEPESENDQMLPTTSEILLGVF